MESIVRDQFLTPFRPDKMSYIARRGLSTLIPPKVRIPKSMLWYLSQVAYLILIGGLDRFPQRELPCPRYTPCSYWRPSRPEPSRCPFCPILRHHAVLPFPKQSLTILKAIGAAQDAARMERVVNFYAGLPRGPAPQVKPTGLVGRYQARYWSGKNASGAREYL